MGGLGWEVGRGKGGEKGGKEGEGGRVGLEPPCEILNTPLVGSMTINPLMIITLSPTTELSVVLDGLLLSGECLRRNSVWAVTLRVLCRGGCMSHEGGDLFWYQLVTEY